MQGFELGVPLWRAADWKSMDGFWGGFRGCGVMAKLVRAIASVRLLTAKRCLKRFGNLSFESFLGCKIIF
jgi:hypothetical protein